LAGARRLDGRGERYAPHAHVVSSQELVRPALNPSRHRPVGRAATRWVVLEAAVLGWIVRRRNHDAIREVLLAARVVNEYGPRNHRCWSEAVVSLDHRLHIVRGEDFERGALGRARQGV